MKRMIGQLLLAAACVALAHPAAADRALVVGIDRYADPKLDLGGNGSARDVAAIVGLLQSSLGYGAGDIRVLADGAASRAAIIDGFDTWLIDGTKAGDRVFFYFSGQGHFVPDTDGDEADGLDETLVPADGAVSGSSIAGGISDDELTALLQKLAGRKATVVIDAGHSGLVSRGAAAAPANAKAFRAAVLQPLTRSIIVEPSAKAQKAEGAPIDTAALGGDVAVFTATSGGQAPLVDEDGGGVFTKAFVAAAGPDGADANGNGVVSNAEILADVQEKSADACAATEGCELGLTPTLEPVAALGASPILSAAAADHLTPDQVLDFFGKGNTFGVSLEQFPPSPVHVGDRDIRFRIVSPAQGNLVLLDLGDDGTLIQLFPNEHSRKGGREGFILADSPIVVPDDYYGISFNATSPTSGTLIALVTGEPVELPPTVATRKIEVIPRQEATEVFLPELAGVLGAPVDAGANTPTRAIDWSVATLRYEIIP